MLGADDPDGLPLPKGWPAVARRAILHALSLSAAAFNLDLARWLDNPMPEARERTEARRLRAEIDLLTEELRVKDARSAATDPHRRARYKPVDRMAILEIRARRGLTQAETAARFHLTEKTVATWMRRLDEEGEAALVRTPEPVNKLPAFVGHVLRSVRMHWPGAGEKRIAQVLARAGLHVGATTVRRATNEATPPRKNSSDVEATSDETPDAPRTVRADYPAHVVNVDLTIMPTLLGFFTMLPPNALPQVWPFCWWIGIAMDHFSRRVIGFAVFLKQPTSLQVRRFLGRAFGRIGKVPKYTVTDKGGQFWCKGFKRWCRRRKIKPRYGAIGGYGSIAVIERFMRTFKDECLRRIQVPLRVAKVREEIRLYVLWYNAERPHQSLNGRTPDEVYFDREPANEKSRYETRRKWPREGPCATPWAPVKGRRGVRLGLDAGYLEGRKHLPVIRLKTVA